MIKEILTLRVIPFAIGFIGFQVIFHLMILPMMSGVNTLQNTQKNVKTHQVK
jgi:fumarate reductase subunit D